MSDSSLRIIDSLSESNLSTELDLVDCLNRLSISINSNQSDSINNLSKILESSNTTNNLEMSTTPTLDIKNLSIIPNFDGNPNKLYRFISASESILKHYFNLQDTSSFQNVLLLNGILNKLEGRAEEVVAINGSDSWDQIKSTLIKNFGDQRDENCLNQDLVNLKQKPNELPNQFHERVIHLLNTICNHIDLNCENNERKSKRDFFTKQALKTFLAGLREPLGPIIRAMRPTTLVEALQYITEEDNIKYYQKSYQPNILPKKSFSQNPQNNFQTYRQQQIRPFSQQPNFYQQPQFSQRFPQPSTSNQFPRAPINMQRHPNPPNQRFPTNTQVFGKPQNVWKPNPRIPQTKPTPMSLSTRNTTPQFRNQYQNNGQTQKFISEELFNTEFDEQPQLDYDPNYSYDESQPLEQYYPEENYDQNENFQEPPNQTDTT